MYKISVIMPIYNNETTLRHAIDSILNQSLFSFELILINDGSTDSSVQICKEYEKKEPLVIQVIQQGRLGLASARNRGLSLAKGNYIYFADPENILGPRMLETTLRLAEENSAELVVFGFIEMEEAIEQIPRMPLLLTKERFRNHYRNFHNFFPYELCNKLYQTQYLRDKKIEFSNYPLKEVAFFNVAIYQDLSKVVFNRNVLCQKGKKRKWQWDGYEENYRVIHLKLIDKLTKMLISWDLKEEYEDLIIKECYQLLKKEILMLSNADLNLPALELENEIIRLLQDKQITDIIDTESQLLTKSFYKRALWNNFRQKNIRGILRLINNEKQVNKLTQRIKQKFSNWSSN